MKFVLIYDKSTEMGPRTQAPAYVYIVVDKWGLALKGLETLSSVFFNSDVAHDAAQIQTTALPYRDLLS